MLSLFQRTAARSAMIAAPSMMRSVAVTKFAPVRAFTARSMTLAKAPVTIDENGIPSDLHIRYDSDGIRWADYRPEALRNITCVRNEDGDLVGPFGGEIVFFPDLEPTLEWVCTTPFEGHLFEESPIIKMYDDEIETDEDTQ